MSLSAFDRLFNSVKSDLKKTKTAEPNTDTDLDNDDMYRSRFLTEEKSESSDSDDVLSHEMEDDSDDVVEESTRIHVLTRASDLGLIDVANVYRVHPELTERVKVIRVKVDPKARIQSLTKTTALTIARQKQDPKYAKYKKLRKMTRALKQELFKKYGNVALKQAKSILKGVSDGKIVKLDPPAVPNKK